MDRARRCGREDKDEGCGWEMGGRRVEDWWEAIIASFAWIGCAPAAACLKASHEGRLGTGHDSRSPVTHKSCKLVKEMYCQIYN